MKLFTPIVKWLLKSLPSVSLQNWAQGGSGGNEGGATLSNAYLQSVWVYSAINALGQNVAQVPFRFSRGEARGEDVIENGPLVDLLNHPHPQLDRFLFWELIVAWLMLRGEAFVYPEFGGARLSEPQQQRIPSRLIVLCPDHFHEIVETNALAGWRYTSTTDSAYPSEVFLPKEIIHLKLPNPYYFWRGLSPLTIALLAASTDYAAAQFMKGLMTNNADTGVIVRTDQQLDAEQREQMLAALRERKRKAGTADRPLLLWGGAEVVKPTLSSTDMQFLENRKFNRQEIFAVFGVPQEIVGYTEDANRSVSESARLNFTENRIAPLCERIESAFAPQIKRIEANLFGWFDVDSLPIMQKARQARVDTGVKLFSIGFPINEINQTLDLGFSDLKWGDKSFLPFGLQEVGAETAANEPGVQPPNTPQPQPDEVQSAFGRMLKLVGSSRGDDRTAQRAVPTPHQCAAPSEYEAELRARVGLKLGKLSMFFFEQRNRVLARLNSETLKTEQRGLADLFNFDEENATLMGRMRTLLLADLSFGGAKLFAEIGNPMDSFKLPPEEAIKFMGTRQKEIQSINDTTWDALRKSLQEGLANGDTTLQLADRVKAVYQDATDLRAETIAVTETNIALNSGRFIGMAQAGVELKRWRTSNLANVRPSHKLAEAASANGIPIDQPFSNGLMYPGDPEGDASEVINCRCYMAAVVPQMTPA